MSKVKEPVRATGPAALCWLQTRPGLRCLARRPPCRPVPPHPRQLPCHCVTREVCASIFTQKAVAPETSPYTLRPVFKLWRLSPPVDDAFYIATEYITSSRTTFLLCNALKNASGSSLYWISFTIRCWAVSFLLRKKVQSIKSARRALLWSQLLGRPRWEDLWVRGFETSLGTAARLRLFK